MRVVAVVLMSLFGLLQCCHAATESAAVVDLGWLRATHESSGWLINRAHYLSSDGDKVVPGDLLVFIDDQRIADCNAITAAAFLLRIGTEARTAQVLRNGRNQILHLMPSPDSRLRLIGPQFVSDVAPPIYADEAPAPRIELQDQLGKIHQVKYGPSWTLIHVWTTSCSVCWRDISALNEMLNPPSTGLEIIVIAINDTAQSIDDFSRRQPFNFYNLLGGKWIGGSIARAFNPTQLPADVLVDPSGYVMFVGAGSDSLHSALEYTKQKLPR